MTVTDDLVSAHDHYGPDGRCRRCVAEGREEVARELVAAHGKLLGRHHRDQHVTRETCPSCRALAETLRSEHQHRWVDATNEVVTGGEMCPDCGAIRPLRSPDATETTT